MPIVEFSYNDNGDRTEAANRIREAGGSVVDLGGCGSCFDGKLDLDLCVDIVPPRAKFDRYLIGDLQEQSTFDKIEEDNCKMNDRGGWEDFPFDWAICTHTLEDLHWPVPCLRNLPRIAKAGFLAMPSAYDDLMQHHGTLGYVHHRTVWLIEDGILVGYPKIPYLCSEEIKDEVDRKAKEGYNRGDRELVIWWHSDLPFRMIHLGPTLESVKETYQKLVSRL